MRPRRYPYQITRATGNRMFLDPDYIRENRLVLLPDSNDILNHRKYSRVTVETVEGKEIAEITLTDVTSAAGYVVRLTPAYSK